MKTLCNSLLLFGWAWCSQFTALCIPSKQVSHRKITQNGSQSPPSPLVRSEDMFGFVFSYSAGQKKLGIEGLYQKLHLRSWKNQCRESQIDVLFCRHYGKGKRREVETEHIIYQHVQCRSCRWSQVQHIAKIPGKEIEGFWRWPCSLGRSVGFTLLKTRIPTVVDTANGPHSSKIALCKHTNGSACLVQTVQDHHTVIIHAQQFPFGCSSISVPHDFLDLKPSDLDMICLCWYATVLITLVMKSFSAHHLYAIFPSTLPDHLSLPARLSSPKPAGSIQGLVAKTSARSTTFCDVLVSWELNAIESKLVHRINMADAQFPVLNGKKICIIGKMPHWRDEAGIG